MRSNLVLLLSWTALLLACLPAEARAAEAPKEARLPAIAPTAPYVGSQACQSCHTKEHTSWHRTYHRTMTQEARPETVLGKFDGTTVISDDLSYRVSQDSEGLWAEMPDPDVMMYVTQGGKKLPFSQIPRTRLPVVMSTGSHHYQTYWVASKRHPGLLQTLPLVYLIEDQRWVPREAAFLRGPNNQGRMVTQWNSHCIKCHSTGGSPGLDEATGMLKTKVSDLGISCEACHGPGEEHVKKQRELMDRFEASLARTPDTSIVNPANLDFKRSTEVCGQCHGVFVNRDEFALRYAKEGSLYHPGGDLHQSRYYVQHPRANPSPEREADFKRNPEFFEEGWWSDGTIMAGGREYTALLGAPCHTKGQMTCLSCHSMHRSDPSDQLKLGMDGPAACVQCHSEPKYTTEISRHTFHLPASRGSDCLNCHMPHTTYALLKSIRSHQISSPKVLSGPQAGAPNACNLCHLDKTLAWTQASLKERYGLPAAELAPDEKNVSAAILWMLKGNAAQRAVAAWHAGWKPAQEASGTNWLAPHAAHLLEDSYGVVRHIAARSIKTMPGFKDFSFDFLASEARLKQDRNRAMEIWKRGGAPDRLGRAMLIDASGKVMEEEANALLKARDNRPITVTE